MHNHMKQMQKEQKVGKTMATKNNPKTLKTVEKASDGIWKKYQNKVRQCENCPKKDTTTLGNYT